MDRGDGPYIFPNWLDNQLFFLRLEALEAILHNDRFHFEVVEWLRFFITHGMEDEAIDMLVEIRFQLEQDDDDDDEDDEDDEDDGSDIAAVDGDLDDDAVEEAPAEPQADIEDNLPAEAEDPLPGGSRRSSREEDNGDDDDESDEFSRERFRRWGEWPDTVTDSDTDSDAEQVASVSAPPPSPELGGFRKRPRDEEDDDDGRDSKQCRH